MKSCGEVAAVVGGSLFNEILKLLFVENGGVFGKKQEEYADEIDFEGMTCVANFFEAVVEFTH